MPSRAGAVLIWRLLASRRERPPVRGGGARRPAVTRSAGAPSQLSAPVRVGCVSAAPPHGPLSDPTSAAGGECDPVRLRRPRPEKVRPRAPVGAPPSRGNCVPAGESRRLGQRGQRRPSWAWEGAVSVLGRPSAGCGASVRPAAAGRPRRTRTGGEYARREADVHGARAVTWHRRPFRP